MRRATCYHVYSGWPHAIQSITAQAASWINQRVRIDGVELVAGMVNRCAVWARVAAVRAAADGGIGWTDRLSVMGVANCIMDQGDPGCVGSDRSSERRWGWPPAINPMFSVFRAFKNIGLFDIHSLRMASETSINPMFSTVLDFKNIGLFDQNRQKIRRNQA